MGRHRLGSFADDLGTGCGCLHSGHCRSQDLGGLVHPGLHLHLHCCLCMVREHIPRPGHGNCKTQHYSDLRRYMLCLFLESLLAYITSAWIGKFDRLFAQKNSVVLYANPASIEKTCCPLLAVSRGRPAAYHTASHPSFANPCLFIV